MNEAVDSDFLKECGYGDTEQQEDKFSEEYEKYLMNLRSVANTPSGVHVLCFLLETLGTFEPSWSEKNPKLARQAVLKDFGNDILDDLSVASPAVHDSVQREMRSRRKRAGTLYKQKPKKEKQDG